MTGPSPWRLSSPRGGVTSVTVSGSTIEPVGSIILLPVPGTTLPRVRETSSKGVAQQSRGNVGARSEEHTSELQSQSNLVCRLLLEKKKKKKKHSSTQTLYVTKVL